MPNEPEPTLKEQTGKIFKDTVEIYRKDLHAIFGNPLPLILALAALILFWLLVRWL